MDDRILSHIISIFINIQMVNVFVEITAIKQGTRKTV